MTAVKTGLRYLALTVVLVLILFPLFYMVRVAFTSPRLYRTPEPDWFAPIYLDSMRSVLDSGFMGLLLNSAILSVGTTAAVMAVASVAAHALARQRSVGLRRHVMFFALSTRMGPAVVFALPFFVMMSEVNLIDTFPGMFGVYIFYNLAFAMWLLHGFFVDVPTDIEEAGIVDGLSSFGAFLRIAVPSALPGIVATAMLVFIMTWNEFFYALVLTQRDVGTFPTGIPAFFGAFRVEWGQMFAASALGVIPPLLFGLIMRRYLVRGLSLGATE
jgi:multiple sugar transport system permease protein